MPKQEILPPIRNLPVTVEKPSRAVITVDVPGTHTGGYIQSALNDWRWRYTTKAVDSLTTLNTAEAKLYTAQTAVIETTIRKRAALALLQELPERLGHELAVRRVDRANELREVQHHYEVHELRRVKEVAEAESGLRRAQAALVDAQQALQAQRDFGYTTYELAWKKKHLEMLDVELSAAERRAILDQHLGELDRGADSTGPRASEEVEDALYHARAELSANGLDTTTVDEAIERLKRRG